MKLGLVSICIPTFNGAQYLEEALNSVGAQTYKNIELIVSDDLSSDSTLAIVKCFKNKIDFPVFVYKHIPSGIGANWNNCISKSNGKYIKFLFQDDLLMPDCVELMINTLEENKELGMVASKRIIINEIVENKWTLNWLTKYGDLQQNLNLPSKKINIINSEIFKHTEFCKDPFNKIGEPTSIMFRKDLINKIGLFRTDLKQILDLEFYYRVLKFYKIGIINENLVGFRLHPGQASQDKNTNHKEEYRIFRRILFYNYFKYFNRKDKMHLIKDWLKFAV